MVVILYVVKMIPFLIILIFINAIKQFQFNLI